MGTAWIATVIAIRNRERFLIQHRRLNPRPRAHISANLFAQRAGEHIGGGGQKASEHIGRHGRLQGKEAYKQAWCIMKIGDEPATCSQRNHQPNNVFTDLSPSLIEIPSLFIEANALITVAFKPMFNRDEEIGPNRLRAGIATPDTAKKG